MNRVGRKIDRCLPVALVFLLVQFGIGCTLKENLRRDPGNGSSPPEAAGTRDTVDRRTSDLAVLEESSGGKAEGEIARARTVLEEMVYFSDKGDVEEIDRLDGLMVQALDSARNAVETGPEPSTERIANLQVENSALRSRVSKVESRAAQLEEELLAKETVYQIRIDLLTNRLQAAEKSRDDAIREVVRVRSRMEGMASKAEASAMFAEARVLVDRMNEDAFNNRAREDLQLARGYLAAGKKELEAGNPGGAAYLFDLISSTYEGFRTSNPRQVRVSVRKALLYRTASGSGQAIGSLSRGQTAVGLQVRGERVQVKLSSGLIGWIRKSQVH
jgi:hypothetical protein